MTHIPLPAFSASRKASPRILNDSAADLPRNPHTYPATVPTVPHTAHTIAFAGAAGGVGLVGAAAGATGHVGSALGGTHGDIHGDDPPMDAIKFCI